MRKYFLGCVLFFTPLWVIASDSNPPAANEVFKLTVKALDPNTFALQWQIKPGYFLYKDRIKVAERTDSNFHVGTIHYPTPIQKTNSQGETFRVYRETVSVPVAILGLQSGEALLDIKFQGCADDGFCYPPQNELVKIAIDPSLALSSATLENTELTHTNDTPIETSSTSHVERIFSQGNFLIILASFFGFGLLLSFTPCVLPMIPVLSGIIVGHGKDLSSRKAFLLSLSYVLSMSVTYAVVGAMVALMGHNLQIAMQSPWAIGLFSFIFVLLAFSMFSFYDLRLPTSWQSKLAGLTRSQASGHYVGAAMMGCLSTLILSPCVTAPLIGALGYIAETGNVFLGCGALFFLGMGMGLPLLLIGTSAAKLLPKAGHWMEGVKFFFGLLMLALALYLLERIFNPVLMMVLWGSLFIFTGVYVGAFLKSHTKMEKFRQGLGIILLTYGVLMLIGASHGNTNPFIPLMPKNSVETTPSSAEEKIVKNLAQAEQAIAHAKGKPVMLDFYADWCTSCKVIAATTLQEPDIQRMLSQFELIKVDLTANTAESKAILQRFKVVAPPTFLFFDADGEELNHLRLVGEISTKNLLQALQSTI